MSSSSRATPTKKDKAKPKAGKPPAKSAAPAKSAPASAPKPKAPASRPKPKSRGTGVQRPLPAPGMSLDRKLDIAGIALVFLGLGLGASLFTPRTSGLLAALVDGVTYLAGWGRPAIPLAIIALGVWLVLRKFGDKLPRLEPERLLGFLLAYLALLTALHFWAAPNEAQIFETVAAGRGGGVVGALLLAVMLRTVGDVGAAVLLVAWWLIAVVFSAGLSVPELINLVARAFQRLTQRATQTARQLPLPSGPPTSAPTSAPVKSAKPAASQPAASASKAAAAPPTSPPHLKLPSNFITPSPAQVSPALPGTLCPGCAGAPSARRRPPRARLGPPAR